MEFGGDKEKEMAVDMQMTNEEIIRSYKGAAHKGKQIGILADLNACPKEVIIEILIEGGIDRRAFSRVKSPQSIAKEVREHEKKKRLSDEEAITREELVMMKDRLENEYRELEAEWERISAEYRYKLGILDGIICKEVCAG